MQGKTANADFRNVQATCDIKTSEEGFCKMRVTCNVKVAEA